MDTYMNIKKVISIPPFIGQVRKIMNVSPFAIHNEPVLIDSRRKNNHNREIVA